MRARSGEQRRTLVNLIEGIGQTTTASRRSGSTTVCARANNASREPLTGSTSVFESIERRP